MTFEAHAKRSALHLRDVFYVRRRQHTDTSKSNWLFFTCALNRSARRSLRSARCRLCPALFTVIPASPRSRRFSRTAGRSPGSWRVERNDPALRLPGRSPSITAVFPAVPIPPRHPVPDRPLRERLPFTSVISGSQAACARPSVPVAIGAPAIYSCGTAQDFHLLPFSPIRHAWQPERNAPHILPACISAHSGRTPAVLHPPRNAAVCGSSIHLFRRVWGFSLLIWKKRSACEVLHLCGFRPYFKRRSTLSETDCLLCLKKP